MLRSLAHGGTLRVRERLFPRTSSVRDRVKTPSQVYWTADFVHLWPGKHVETKPDRYLDLGANSDGKPGASTTEVWMQLGAPMSPMKYRTRFLLLVFHEALVFGQNSLHDT